MTDENSSRLRLQNNWHLAILLVVWTCGTIGTCIFCMINRRDIDAIRLEVKEAAQTQAAGSRM